MQTHRLNVEKRSHDSSLPPNRGGRRKNKRKRKRGKKKEKKREKRTSCQSMANTLVENIAVSTCLKIPRVPRDIYSGSVNRGESSRL